MKTRARELAEEFRTVVLGRSKLIDAILAPVLFIVLNAVWSFQAAVWGSLALAAILAGVRLFRREAPFYALGGLGATAAAILVARVLNRAEGYFLPNIAMGAGTVLLCLASALVKRPLVAWTSHLARRWPLDWYWHPRVRPAYTEVTLAWAIYFALRLALQWALFQQEAVGLLGVINVVMGWPATIVLLAASYLYGTWRLQHLQGPSVEEFEKEAPPPWEGQRRGF